MGVSRAAVSELLSPVRDVLASGRERLGLGTLPDVRLGAVDGLFSTVDANIVLSEALASDAICHPYDLTCGAVGIDRWRRATVSVLEAAWLIDHAQPTEAPEWVTAGWAAWHVHNALPELGSFAPDLSWCLRTLDVSVHPRLGSILLRMWHDQGHDPEARVMQARQTGRVPMQWFVEAGYRLVRDPSYRADAGFPPLPPAVDVPATLSAWSWARLDVPAHPRGGKVHVDGVGGVRPAWARSGEALVAVGGAGRGGCRLTPRAGGPVGRWDVKSAEGFGQIFGARGVQFVFQASGKVEVILADAFVGSVAELEVADRVGTSGTAAGRWCVAGPRQLTLHDIVPLGLTVHGRDETPYAVPAGPVGMGTWLRAMEGDRWRWVRDGTRLVMKGPMWGTTVEIRLAAAQ
jgi:hypothetical protein